MRLNVGCGRQLADGWVNVDAHDFDTWPTVFNWGADVERQWSIESRVGLHVSPWRRDVLDGLPFVDDTFDGAVAHHVLQMVAWPDLVPWLSEVRRVLKPGAWLRITVPDLISAVDARKRCDKTWFPISDEHERSIDGKLCMYLSQAGATRSLFTSRWLHELCCRAGFMDVHDGLGDARLTYGPPWLMHLDSRLAESIVVEACK